MLCDAYVMQSTLLQHTVTMNFMQNDMAYPTSTIYYCGGMGDLSIV